MSESTRLFNGSTVTFGTAIARLVGVQYKESGTVVDVTEPADTTKLTEVGQIDLEVTIKVKRMPTVKFGDKGTLAITWADGSTTTLSGRWIVTAVDGGGDENNPINGSVSFKPTIPGATGA
jgi:hypothetical protein